MSPSNTDQTGKMLDDVDKLLAITKSKDVIEVSGESVPQDVETSAQLESEDYAKQQKKAELTLPAECVPLNRLVLGDFYSSPS